MFNKYTDTNRLHLCEPWRPWSLSRRGWTRRGGKDLSARIVLSICQNMRYSRNLVKGQIY